MIRTIEFKDFRGHPSIERNDCIVLKANDWVDERHITIAFPFHEDTPNFTMNVPEVLALRNAIDDLTAVKMLEVSPVFTTQETNISFRDKQHLLGILNQYPLENDFERGARHALNRVYNILKLVRGGN